MSTVGIGEPSVIDRCPIAGSLDVLASHLAEVPPGRLAIIAGDEVYASDAAREVVELAEALGAGLRLLLAVAGSPSRPLTPSGPAIYPPRRPKSQTG